MELKGKRLLLLGGNIWKDAVRQFADDHGVVLIATSNDPNAGIFEIADEAYHISSTDAEAMKRLIAEKNIDGVYLGSSEPVIDVACQYVRELGLPCYCTKEQWDFLQNKAKFKELCIECGLPVVSKFEIDENDFEMSAGNLPYPVITKPTDGCGSSGFSVCQNVEELKEGFKRAKEESASGGVLIEKFVKNDGIVVFYTLSDGNVIFSGAEDKYPVRYEEQGSYVAGLFLFESVATKIFRECYDDKIAAMFKKIGLKEGTVWIEVFHDGDAFYFNEVGYRYGGSISIYPVEYFSGINQVASDMYYALTGKSCLHGFTPLIRPEVTKHPNYAVYALHVVPGHIVDMKGIDELLLLDNIVKIPVTKPIGSMIHASGTIAQVCGFVHFSYDDETELRNILRKIQDTVKIVGENGENLLHHMIDPDKLVIRK